MNTDGLRVDALILAGGNNARMNGNYKGALTLGGGTFTGRLIGELRKRADRVFLSFGTEIREEPAGCTPVRDVYPGCGPLAGLHAGLAASRADLVLTAPCDMPLLRAGLYDCLLERMKEEERRSGLRADGIVPVLSGRMEPLAAVYRPSAAPELERQLLAGCRRVRSALAGLRIITVGLDDLPELAAMIVNVNTQTDYERLLENEP